MLQLSHLIKFLSTTNTKKFHQAALSSLKIIKSLKAINDTDAFFRNSSQKEHAFIISPSNT